MPGFGGLISTFTGGGDFSTYTGAHPRVHIEVKATRMENKINFFIFNMLDSFRPKKKLQNLKRSKKRAMISLPKSRAH